MIDAVPQYRPASITLVRHGQSESNLHDPDSVQDVPKELRGTPNHKVQLTPLGHEQARATGAALAARVPDGFDHLYVSPFKRTCQRTYMFLGKLFQPNRHGAHILIVSHATAILTFPFHLERMSEDQLVDLNLKRKIQNCAVGRFEYRPTERPRWARTLWNEVMHGLP